MLGSDSYRSCAATANGKTRGVGNAGRASFLGSSISVGMATVRCLFLVETFGVADLHLFVYPGPRLARKLGGW